MRKLNPKKAAENPLAAAILGAVLVKHGQQENSQAQIEAGEHLLKIAEQNPDKMPRLKPNSKLAKAIKAAARRSAPTPFSPRKLPPKPASA